MTDAQTNKDVAPQLQKGPFVHSLRLYLVGGQQFTLNEVTDSPEIPRNVVAFINAWREKKDVCIVRTTIRVLAFASRTFRSTNTMLVSRKIRKNSTRM